MILYLSDEDSETWVQSCKSTDELPTGVAVVILSLDATKEDEKLAEFVIDRAMKVFKQWGVIQ